MSTNIEITSWLDKFIVVLAQTSLFVLNLSKELPVRIRTRIFVMNI